MRLYSPWQCRQMYSESLKLAVDSQSGVVLRNIRWGNEGNIISACH